MLILAIDTSGKQGSLALTRGDAASFHLIESVPIAGGTFSAQLVPQIAATLARNNLKKETIDGFAAASGPGSFTGLRVGLAAIKGLAEILQRPIAAVSVLEAVAAAAKLEGKVAALLDAQRHEIFVGQYEIRAGKPVMLREFICDQLAEITRDQLAGFHLITPDATVAAALPDDRVQIVSRPGSPDIARLGLQKIIAGETVSVEALDANYIRRSDAEIFSTRK